MSHNSPILSLPYIQPAQAQKHVTHNEALRVLDAITQLTVISGALSTPPALPSEGDRYIVTGGATDDWAGQEAMIAVWVDNAWQFFAPQRGWRADVSTTGDLMRFDGVAWEVVAVDLQNVPLVGVNAAADPTNRLAVSSEATLFNNAGAGHQLKLNKASIGDTASLLFQTGFAGRAEMGTAGSDDFAIKVSADGNTYATALQAEAATGAIQFPSGQTFFQEIYLPNDAAWSIEIPWADPMRVLLWTAVDLQGLAFLTALTGSPTGAANFASVFEGQAATLSYLSGALSGSTGTAGGIALSIEAGGTPRLWLENRLGTAQTFTLATLGR
ncbi:MAG: DUF2793 domain-containing protein [Pseudomonadota bacterium]